MAATIPNVAKGRINEFAWRVNNNDPTTAGFKVILLQNTGLETLAVLRDHDTLSAILTAANTECTVASYARLELDDTDVTDPTIDDSGDKQTFDVGDFDFGSLESGQTIAASVMCYFNATGDADTLAIPVHISIPASTVATNAETFHFKKYRHTTKRTPCQQFKTCISRLIGIAICFALLDQRNQRIQSRVRF